MSGWIKFWKDMPNDPRVLAAAMNLSERYTLTRGGSNLSTTEKCNAWRNAVTGALATLWCYADEHIRDDDTLPLTSQTLDAVVGIEGFFEAMPREWIDELDDGSIVLPGYCEKNSLIAKRKRTVKSNARVTQWRRANKTNGNGVTSEHETQCNVAGDLDQDLYQDSEKNPTASSTPRNGKTRTVSHEADPEWWLNFRARYPDRAGDQGWRKAQRAAHARMAEGHTPVEFIAGAERYAAFIAATEKTGTEFVKQASSFLGPEKPFLLPWAPPPSKAQVRQDKNLDATQIWLREQEAKDAAH